MNPKVDWYFEKPKKWQKELQAMRSIALECNLTEDLKWGCPCYTFEKKNIVLIHDFKEYCAYLFFKGAILKDPKGILIQQTENVQAARQIRFTNVKDIVKMKKVLQRYIYEAVKVEDAGLKVPLKKTKEFKMPEEFETRLKKNAALKKAFYALTPGRQRGYLLYFASAKQAKTRESRIGKYVDHILEGMGLEDEYKSTMKPVKKGR
jgi:uncharacterized protein YdeI (YjbR/CyaY-like superfamily)